MKLTGLLKGLPIVLNWYLSYARTYESQVLLIDAAVIGSDTFEDPDAMRLIRSNVTLKNFKSIILPFGIILSQQSILTVIPPFEPSVSFDFTIEERVNIDSGSNFYFDGSHIEYATNFEAASNFRFIINTGADGLVISTGGNMHILLPKMLDNYFPNNFVPTIQIGGTYKFPYNSPFVIEGVLNVQSAPKDSEYFDTRIWGVDLGPDFIDENGISKVENKLTGIIECVGVIKVYSNIFRNSENPILKSLGHISFVKTSHFTLDVSEGPIILTNVPWFCIILSSGQKNMNLIGMRYIHISGSQFPATLGIGLMTDGIVDMSYDNQTISLHDSINPSGTNVVLKHPLNMGFLGYVSVNGILPRFPASPFSALYMCVIFESVAFTTTETIVHETTTEIVEIFVSVTRGPPFNQEQPLSTITKTIYNQPQQKTSILEGANNITEYHIIDYKPVLQDNRDYPFSTATYTSTLRPPPLLIDVVYEEQYVESQWISFFITIGNNNQLITSSSIINATRKYYDRNPPNKSLTYDSSFRLDSFSQSTYSQPFDFSSPSTLTNQLIPSTPKGQSSVPVSFGRASFKNRSTLPVTSGYSSIVEPESKYPTIDPEIYSYSYLSSFIHTDKQLVTASSVDISFGNKESYSLSLSTNKGCLTNYTKSLNGMTEDNTPCNSPISNNDFPFQNSSAMEIKRTPDSLYLSVMCDSRNTELIPANTCPQEDCLNCSLSLHSGFSVRSVYITTLSTSKNNMQHSILCDSPTAELTAITSSSCIHTPKSTRMLEPKYTVVTTMDNSETINLTGDMNNNRGGTLTYKVSEPTRPSYEHNLELLMSSYYSKVSHDIKSLLIDNGGENTLTIYSNLIFSTTQVNSNFRQSDVRPDVSYSIAFTTPATEMACATKVQQVFENKICVNSSLVFIHESSSNSKTSISLIVFIFGLDLVMFLCIM